MDLLVKIGKQTYRIEIETQKIKPIKADTEPASATVVFASYHLDRAAAYRRTSPNHPESIKEMRLAFSIDPNGEHTNLFLAGFNLRIKQYALAGTCFYRVTEINPRNTLALIGAGLVHAHFNEYVQARDLFSQAIEINPQYPIPYYLGWDLSTKDGDTQQAKEYLEWLVAINPFDILAVSLLAEIKLADQDYEGLKAFLSDSETGFDLTNFIVDFYKGLAYYQTGEPGKAKEKLESSLANSSTIVFSSSVMLGELALKKRDFPKAAQHFQVAITLKPDFCPGYLSLAQTYRAQGKPREAQKMEQQAARCGKQ
jgi:tetratricopeptide (TPR) repeat protein